MVLVGFLLSTPPHECSEKRHHLLSNFLDMIKGDIQIWRYFTLKVAWNTIIFGMNHLILVLWKYLTVYHISSINNMYQKLIRVTYNAERKKLKRLFCMLIQIRSCIVRLCKCTMKRGHPIIHQKPSI